MDGELFLTWVKLFLCPAPDPGDVVVLDNLGAHKVAGVRKAICKAQATLLYLPPYSPDMNPIEKMFSNSHPGRAWMGHPLVLRPIRKTEADSLRE